VFIVQFKRNVRICVINIQVSRLVNCAADKQLKLVEICDCETNLLYVQSLVDVVLCCNVYSSDERTHSLYQLI